mmetsp:Transcript_83730/g.215588  ORF Transcript_83730/g.215588 Transcript_83730/m.215588 type:complete len:578 (+) Transcript_83730:192-1925(+)
MHGRHRPHLWLAQRKFRRPRGAVGRQLLTLLVLLLHKCSPLLLAGDDVHAVLPLVDGLERVEGHTLTLSASASAVVREENVHVLHVPDAEGVHAALEEAVLPGVGAKELGATLGIVEVDLHRAAREHLDGAEEAAVAQPLDAVVLEVDGSVGRRLEGPHVAAEALGQEDAVGVHLDGPVVLQVQAGLLDPLEYLQEHGRVDEGGLTCVPARSAGLPGVEDGVGIAAEDARVVVPRRLLQFRLRGVGQHGHDAVEGHARHLALGRRRHLVLGPPAAQHRAVPAGGQSHRLLEEGANGQGLLAAREGIVLLRAVVALVAAEARLAAFVAGPGAACVEARAVAELRAVPALLRAILLDQVQASGVVLVLLEAGHAEAAARPAAALRLGAVLPRRGAWVLHALVHLPHALIVARAAIRRGVDVAGLLAGAILVHAPVECAALVFIVGEPAGGLALVTVHHAVVLLPASLASRQHAAKHPALVVRPGAAVRRALVLLVGRARGLGGVADLLTRPLVEHEGARGVVVAVRLALVDARCARARSHALAPVLVLREALEALVATVHAALARQAVLAGRRAAHLGE